MTELWDEMMKIAEAALAAGVPQVQLGHLRCAFCGEELGPVVDTELLEGGAHSQQVVRVHLCHRCYKRYKKAGKRRR